MDKNVQKRVQAPKNMPAPIKLLMDDCLQEDPDHRPSFEEIDLRLRRLDADTATPEGHKRSTQVSLFDIFPRHIAEALRDGRKVEAEHKENVTIFFSDIGAFELFCKVLFVFVFVLFCFQFVHVCVGVYIIMFV
jgi:hypothetical protein